MTNDDLLHLERNVLVLELLAVVEGGFGCGAPLAAAAARSAAFGTLIVAFGRSSTTATTTTAATLSVAAADELKVLDHHGQLAAFAAALLVLPAIELQPPLDEDGLALGEVLVDHLGGLGEGRAVNEGGFLAVLTVLT